MSKHNLPADQRKRLLALIHIAKKDSRMSDGDYRTFLKSVTGLDSSKDMDAAQLQAVVDGFRQMGWKVGTCQSIKGKLSPKTRAQKGRKSMASKIRALWIECFKAGVVTNRYEEGLNAYVQRMTGIDRVDWIRRPSDGRTVIEALKKMLEERGGADG